MALSDEDRAAIHIVRAMMAAVPLDDRLDKVGIDALNRVLRLAGEEPTEPDEGTFWLGPEENDLWIRDDRAVSFGFDLDRWFRTGDDEKFSWSRVLAESPQLVELVRADEAAKRYRMFLMELHGAWEAWHHNACGRKVPLSGCEYYECAHRWGMLLGYGFEKEGEGI
jgi:hypothetical protein